MFTTHKTLSRLGLLLLTISFVLLPGMLLAQDESCQGQDPTGNSTTCPLDTWVWVLVIAAAVFGVVTLSAKRAKERYVLERK